MDPYLPWPPFPPPCHTPRYNQAPPPSTGRPPRQHTTYYGRRDDVLVLCISISRNIYIHIYILTTNLLSLISIYSVYFYYIPSIFLSLLIANSILIANNCTIIVINVITKCKSKFRCIATYVMVAAFHCRYSVKLEDW